MPVPYPFVLVAMLALSVLALGPAQVRGQTVPSDQEAAETVDADPAGDAARGAELYRRACAQCHGRTARGASSYPGLTGKPAEFLTEALATYRAGERRGANSALMFGPARALSDEDIADLVAHLTGLDR